MTTQKLSPEAEAWIERNRECLRTCKSFKKFELSMDDPFERKIIEQQQQEAKEITERRRQHLEMIQSELEDKNNKEQSMSHKKIYGPMKNITTHREEIIKQNNKLVDVVLKTEGERRDSLKEYDEKLDAIAEKLFIHRIDGNIESRPSDQEFKELHAAGYCTCDEDVGYTCDICESQGLTFRQYLTKNSKYNYETLSWEEK